YADHVEHVDARAEAPRELARVVERVLRALAQIRRNQDVFRQHDVIGSSRSRPLLRGWIERRAGVTTPRARSIAERDVGHCAPSGHRASSASTRPCTKSTRCLGPPTAAVRGVAHAGEPLRWRADWSGPEALPMG